MVTITINKMFPIGIQVVCYVHFNLLLFCLNTYLGSLPVTTQKFCAAHCEEIDSAFPIVTKGGVFVFL
jgi:hypothetical protein